MEISARIKPRPGRKEANHDGSQSAMQTGGPIEALRILASTPAGAAIPPAAKWLLVVVAASQRGEQPAWLYDEQLCDACGWPRRQTLTRARAMLMGAGWLTYAPPVEGVRRAGLYAISVPVEFRGTDNSRAAGPPRKGGDLCGTRRGQKSACPALVTKTGTGPGGRGL